MSLFDQLGRAAAAAREAALEQAAAHFLKAKMEGWGKLKHLRIDLQQKLVAAEIELKGEREPIRATWRNYRLVDEHGKTYLKGGEVETSREWLTVLAVQCLERQGVEVPRLFKAAL